jgi:hypothetical protein
VKSLLARGISAGVIGTLAVVVGTIGVATAANGGALKLGHKNHATSTTTLKDNSGTPLKLVGSKAAPPLKVNSSKQVPHLNASLLQGFSAKQLVAGGSTAGSGHRNTTASPLGDPLSSDPATATEVAATATLGVGTYIVTGVAEAYGGPGGAACFLSAGEDAAASHAGTPSGIAAVNTNADAVVQQVITITSAEKVGYFCYSTQTNAKYYEASVTAIQIPRFADGS